MQMAVMSDPTVGKHAVTHYRVERLGYVTLVECILETDVLSDPCPHETYRTCAVQ